MAKKKTAEKVQQPKEKKLVQYLFRADRQKEKEKEGWKKVNPTDVTGEKAVAKGDLVLMEKKV